MAKRPSRSSLEDWQVKVCKTSIVEGPWTLAPRGPDEPDIQIRAGESLMLDFGRSIDLAFTLDNDQIAPLPSDSFLDPLAGCFGWQPANATPAPIVLQFVSGARSLTASIMVTKRD